MGERWSDEPLYIRPIRSSVLPRGAQLLAARSEEAQEGGPLVEEPSAFEEALGRFQRIFGTLARDLREAERVRQENDRLREENRLLRESLTDCVEAWSRFLAPALDAWEDEHRAAEDALTRARALLAQTVPPALPASALLEEHDERG